MCGIVGILQKNHDTQGLESIVNAMRDALIHRGPDDKGSWVDSTNGGVALGHRRLSIVELTNLGAQPMCSRDGRYVIVFNGEIYNFLRLREELSGLGHHFNGGSDTEVALAAFVQWGIESALKRFEGMFAIGLWDQQEQCLYLARDRFGEKPLYYGIHGGVFLFGSELKALRQHPAFSSTIDRDALTALLRYTYIPSPHCIFKHYRKLPPASYLRINRELSPGDPQTYWNLDDISNEPELDITDTEALHELERLMGQSIQEKMIADVPLGAFLSGGIDSSLIVSLMREHTSKPIKTFTIGFDDTKINEAEEARQTSNLLGTDHHELYLTDKNLMDIIPDIPRIYDEPFADPSQLPTSLVSRLARDNVTVALSGDGGDELFAGYKRYPKTIKRWGSYSHTPDAVRRLQAWHMKEIMSRLHPGRKTKYLKLSRMKLEAHDLRLFYRNQMSYCLNPAAVVLKAHEPASPFLRGTATQAGAAPWRWLTTTDAQCYLPDDILVKIDRAAMASSLETRAPFLDSRVAEFACRLPIRMKNRDGVLKWLPKQLLGQYLPPDVLLRSKKGFGVPLGKWLNGPLREWSDDLINPARLKEEGYFDVASITALRNSQNKGHKDATWPLWSVLMFQSWLDNFLNSG